MYTRTHVVLYLSWITFTWAYLTTTTLTHYVYFPEEANTPFVDQRVASPIGELIAAMETILGQNPCLVFWSGNYTQPPEAIVAAGGAVSTGGPAGRTRSRQQITEEQSASRSTQDQAERIARLLTATGGQTGPCYTLEMLLTYATANLGASRRPMALPAKSMWGPRERKIWTFLSIWIAGKANGQLHYVRGTLVRIENVFEKDEYPEVVRRERVSVIHKYHWSFGIAQSWAVHRVLTYRGPLPNRIPILNAARNHAQDEARRYTEWQQQQAANVAAGLPIVAFRRLVKRSGRYQNTPEYRQAMAAVSGGGFARAPAYGSTSTGSTSTLTYGNGYNSNGYGNGYRAQASTSQSGQNGHAGRESSPSPSDGSMEGDTRDTRYWCRSGALRCWGYRVSSRHGWSAHVDVSDAQDRKLLLGYRAVSQPRLYPDDPGWKTTWWPIIRRNLAIRYNWPEATIEEQIVLERS